LVKVVANTTAITERLNRMERAKRVRDENFKDNFSCRVFCS
jgi:hypothetical protein